MKNQLTRQWLLLLCMAIFSTNIFATNYYVDPSSTSSTANGSISSPWKSIAQLNSGASVLYPGDNVYFKRGQSYSGQLNIPSSGTAANPITYTNYGTGNLPSFNTTVFTVISIYSKQYVVIDGIQIIDNTLASDVAHNIAAHIKYAITLDRSPNCTIKNCDISLVATGINVLAGSDNTTISGNFIHNMRMTVNTPTTVNNNDDCGANPVVLASSYNNITYNRFEECWALSYDYGFDGGAFEFFGAAINNNKIMYNTAINCVGFVEIGSSTGGVCNNNVIAYNKIINCGASGTYQNSGSFVISINNLQYYNNIMIETIRHYDQTSNVFWMSGTGNPGMVVVKNNIFYLSTGINVAQTKFNTGQLVHSNNIYRMSSGVLGITANSTELVSNNASLFASVSGDPSTWNLNQISGSPAYNFGTGVGLTQDFAGNPIVGNPDAGLYEKTTTTTLPIVLNSITAVIQDTKSLIKWEVGVETNVSQYQIETSLDGSLFRKIGTVSATGNINYFYIDENTSAGINYYRIKALDIDGSSIYSKIVSVRNNEASERMIIYPNPVFDGVINIKNPNNSILRIYNSIGLLVMQKKLIKGAQQFSVNQLAAGYYVVKTETESAQLIIK